MRGCVVRYVFRCPVKCTDVCNVFTCPAHTLMAITYHLVSAKLSRIDSIKWCKYAVELWPYIQAFIIGGCVRNRQQ